MFPHAINHQVFDLVQICHWVSTMSACGCLDMGKGFLQWQCCSCCRSRSASPHSHSWCQIHAFPWPCHSTCCHCRPWCSGLLWQWWGHGKGLHLLLSGVVGRMCPCQYLLCHLLGHKTGSVWCWCAFLLIWLSTDNCWLASTPAVTSPFPSLGSWQLAHGVDYLHAPNQELFLRLALSVFLIQSTCFRSPPECAACNIAFLRWLERACQSCTWCEHSRTQSWSFFGCLGLPSSCQ